MEFLPSDIVLDIVSRVPVESVFACKLVCKTWAALIREGNFSNMHLSRQLNRIHGGEDGNDNLAANAGSCLFFACRIDHPDDYKALLFLGGQLSDEKYIYHQNLKRIHHAPMHNHIITDHLVGSCNGLVCTFQLHEHNLVLDPIYICNPITREYAFLPELVVNKEEGDPRCILNGKVNLYYNMACGFGYVRSTDEYKVVRIYYLDYAVGNVEVYTLGSGCGWRAIGRVSYRLTSSRKGTYANDVIYWISNNKVVAFDLAEEEFRLLSVVPPCLENRNFKDRFGLVALGRHLCLYKDNMDEVRMEIWSLKETWCLEFDIDYKVVVGGSRKKNSSRFQPISLTENGEIIILYARCVLYSYDKKTTLLNRISNRGKSDNLEDVEAIAHVNTFASLEAMGENSKKFKVHSPWDDVTNEFDRVALDEDIDATHFRLE